MNAQEIKNILLKEFPGKEIIVTPSHTGIQGAFEGSFEIQVNDMIFNGTKWEKISVGAYYDSFKPESPNLKPLAEQILFIEGFFRQYKQTSSDRIFDRVSSNSIALNHIENSEKPINKGF